MSQLKCLIIMILTGLLLQSPLKAKGIPGETEALNVMVKADWAAQERRKNRTPDEVSAVRDAYKRAEELLYDLRKMTKGPDITLESDEFKHLRRKVDTADSLDKQSRLVLQKIF